MHQMGHLGIYTQTHFHLGKLQFSLTHFHLETRLANCFSRYSQAGRLRIKQKNCQLLTSNVEIKAEIKFVVSSGSQIQFKI